MKNNSHQTKIFLLSSVAVILFYNQILAQPDPVIQSLYPHPVIELNEWYVHSGDLAPDQVFEHNPSTDIGAVDVYPVIPHGIKPSYALFPDGMQCDLLNPYISQVGEYVDKMKKGVNETLELRNSK